MSLHLFLALPFLICPSKLLIPTVTISNRKFQVNRTKVNIYVSFD